MKQVLISTALFFLVLFVILFTLGRNYHLRGQNSDYLASIIDKHAMLKETKPPRLILAGGSNVAFGIDSKLLQDSLGIPVINLGLHVGLGLDFILNELEDIAMNGDIVVVSPEYTIGTTANYPLLANTVSFFPEAGRYCNVSPVERIESYFQEELHTNLVANFTFIADRFSHSQIPDESNTIYSRHSFNQYGDMTGHLDQLPPRPLHDTGMLFISKKANVERLNKFAHVTAGRKIRVFFAYPSYAASCYHLHTGKIRRYEEYVRKNLKIPVLGTPSDFVFEDNLFYDTAYHLNREGRHQRTIRLLKLLRSHHVPA